MDKKKEHIKSYSKFHSRNKHQGKYDFGKLSSVCPELTEYIHVNQYGKETIDFFDPVVVKLFNKALLVDFYGLKFWDIPDGYLCPPVPSRSDYIHHVADLLGEFNRGKIPKGKKVKGLDVGVGANCIYPIVGVGEYGWSFVGSDLDDAAIRSSQEIVLKNKRLKGLVEIRKQKSSSNIFQNIIGKEEYFDFSMCNPPFHASAEESQKGTLRKLKNLKQEKIELNFGGKNNELWTEGGEAVFIQKMIRESKLFSSSVLLFSTLVSKKENLKKIYAELKTSEAREVRTIEMNHGNKKSRIVAWTFLTQKQRMAWVKYRWA